MIKVSDTQKRALRILTKGPVDYHLEGNKPTDWDKSNWKFNTMTLRELKQMGLADYVIIASCRRTWHLTEEGKKICAQLWPSLLASS